MTSHVALSHTPFHLLQLGVLAQELGRSAQDLHVFHEGSVPSGVPGLEMASVIELPGSTGYRDARRVSASNAERVVTHQSWAEDSTFYASDLKWLTNNLVYASRSRRLRQARTILITDGLGSYLNRRDGVRTILTALAKSALGVVGYGPRHRPFLHNHFGLDRRYVAAVMGFNSERIVGDLPKIALEVPPSQAPLSEPQESSLVIGAPLDTHRFSSDRARQIVETMASAAVSRTPAGARLAYKPHHFEHAWIATWYETAGFEVIRDARPAELIVREQKFRRIFGTYSSGLAFAPQFATTPCDAFSVSFDAFSDGYLNQRDRAELRRVLETFSVKFL